MLCPMHLSALNIHPIRDESEPLVCAVDGHILDFIQTFIHSFRVHTVLHLFSCHTTGLAGNHAYRMHICIMHHTLC